MSHQPSSLDLSDDDFFTAFDHQFEGYTFPHRAHLRLAWLCVRHLGVERAVERIAAGIRAIAEKAGRPALYHDTLTRAWVYAVAAADTEQPGIATFDQFLEAHPELLDKNCLLRFYSPERLSSPEARTHWLSPDLQPIPGADVPADAGGQRVLIPPLPAQEFARAIDAIPLPVAVITARDATRVHGTTVSSVAAVGRDPAMLVVCVRRDSRLLGITGAAGGFGISYLGADQAPVAAHFADRARGEDVAQFRSVPHVLGPFGAPVLTGGPAWFECRLHHELAVGENQVAVVGTVVAAGTSDARPLQRLHGDWA